MSRRSNFLLLIFLANCLLYGFLVVPYYHGALADQSELRQLREKLSRLEGELADRDKKVAELEVLNDFYVRKFEEERNRGRAHILP